MESRESWCRWFALIVVGGDVLVSHFLCFLLWSKNRARLHSHVIHCVELVSSIPPALLAARPSDVAEGHGVRFFSVFFEVQLCHIQFSTSYNHSHSIRRLHRSSHCRNSEVRSRSSSDRSSHQFSKHFKLVTLVTFEWNRVSHWLGHLSQCELVLWLWTTSWHTCCVTQFSMRCWLLCVKSTRRNLPSSVRTTFRGSRSPCAIPILWRSHTNLKISSL